MAFCVWRYDTENVKQYAALTEAAEVLRVCQDVLCCAGKRVTLCCIVAF